MVDGLVWFGTTLDGSGLSWAHNGQICNWWCLEEEDGGKGRKEDDDDGHFRLSTRFLCIR
jgi:hypothetical protein